MSTLLTLQRRKTLKLFLRGFSGQCCPSFAFLGRKSEILNRVFVVKVRIELIKGLILADFFWTIIKLRIVEAKFRILISEFAQTEKF